MKYDTREKGRMPPAAIEYLLSAFPNHEKNAKDPRKTRKYALISFFIPTSSKIPEQVFYKQEK